MDLSRYLSVYKLRLLLSWSASNQQLRRSFPILLRFALFISPCDPLFVAAKPSLAFPHHLRHSTRPCAAEPSSAPSLSLLEPPPAFVIVPSCSHTHYLSILTFAAYRNYTDLRLAICAGRLPGSLAKVSNIDDKAPNGLADP